ncbi:MAG: DNA-directed RNA polymerase subunit omega [Clostridiales bacterium]|jgi:DNA-directed RNA polymerase omega subunit|nr:DNA-directed RNA polymerase subunit omega [Clostridiales bacterium]
MINEPPIDVLTDNIGDKYKGSKYVLCVVAAKRARQLIDITRSQNSTAILEDKKPLTAAANEILNGKITTVIG